MEMAGMRLAATAWEIDDGRGTSNEADMPTR
jgi:hypothetical protein